MDPAGFNLNGIAVTPNRKYLIVSVPSLSGQNGKLFRVTIKTGRVLPIDVPQSYGGADGLVLLPDGRLLGAGGVPGVHLMSWSRRYREVAIVPVADFDPSFDRVTTAAVLGDRVWFTNSQLDHFVSLLGDNGPPQLPFEIVGIPLSRL